jgi:Fe2+ transport system protein FeoA
MASGCSMIRCPRCGYEFVESGRFIDMLLRWVRRAPAMSCSAGDIVPVSDLPVGAKASIARISSTSAARLTHLASYGIASGSELRIIARKPAVVVACGSSSIALEDEVAGEILVRVA